MTKGMLLVAACKGCRWMCLNGDPNQLAPPVMCDETLKRFKDLGVSFMQKMMTDADYWENEVDGIMFGKSCVILLKTQ